MTNSHSENAPSHIEYEEPDYQSAEFERAMKILFEQASHFTSQVLKDIADDIGYQLLPEGSPIVHQYTDLHGLMGMVTKHQLWTTSVGYLNDSTEYEFGRKVYHDAIQEYIKKPENGVWKECLTHVLSHITVRERNRVFVACLTYNGDQLSQWRGYANDGYGYSVGFATDQFTDIQPAIVPFNILYDEEQQKRFCDELLRRGLPEMAKIVQELGLSPTPEAVALLVQFAINISIPGFKHPGFAEEKELRLFLINDYDVEANKKMVFHERKGLCIPHIPLTFNEGKLPIHEILVGPNLDFEKAKWSLDFLLRQNGYENVNIKKSSVPYLA